MSFEVTGIMHKSFDVESKTETFQTREFVITTEDTYPQYLKFQLTQDRCSIIDGMKDGEKVKVFFDLRGREWNGKYFTNLNAWKIEKQAAAQGADFPPLDNTPPGGFDSFDSDTDFINQDLTDLPF